MIAVRSLSYINIQMTDSLVMIYRYDKIIPQPIFNWNWDIIIIIQSIFILSFIAFSSIMSFSIVPLSLLTDYLIYDTPTFLIMHFNCINVSIL